LGGLTTHSIKPFRTTLLHLKTFQEYEKKVIYLDKFNQENHDGFLEYLEVEHEMSRNTSSKYNMCLLQVIKSAVKKKLFSPVLLGQLEFATSRENSDNIYLNEKELQELINLNDFNSKMEEEVRDLFIVGCYTGLRFSNYSNIGFNNIRNGLIEMIDVKTNAKLEIEIHPYVAKIFKKYNNKLPKSPSNQEFNRTLKDICKRISTLNVSFEKRITKGRRKTIIGKKIWQMVQTHTARRSFCTNMYNRGGPILTIMSFSGHKTEKNFRKYIKSTNEDHRKIIRGYWN
jgi:hypothetical protein